MARAKRYRTEKDALGKRQVPASAYYGIQTLRAIENFSVSGMGPKPLFIKATAMVKAAAAETNGRLGLLDKKKARAIREAAFEIISGRLLDQFLVDVYQAGAGTSHNMNANEVIANRAIEILGGSKGDYSVVHPNDDVNMGQSTNDTFPAAMRVAALLALPALDKSARGLVAALKRKAGNFRNILKSGRTHLQDAVPVTLGMEFSSWAASIESALEGVRASSKALKTIGLGGTAVGTGLNTHPGYRKAVVKALSRISRIRGLKATSGGDSFRALSSMADFTAFSASLRGLAIELGRVANDVRLLSSGPKTGLYEIILPPVQPGSSIMPGKVNPVMAEMLNMVAFQVGGNDAAVAAASGAGQLELNVMGPVINYNILQSMEILTSAVALFTERCTRGIKANRKRCEEFLNNSTGLATLLNPLIGYEKAAEVAKEAVRTGKTVRDVVLERGILAEREWNELVTPKRATGPLDLKLLKKLKKT